MMSEYSSPVSARSGRCAPRYVTSTGSTVGTCIKPTGKALLGSRTRLKIKLTLSVKSISEI
ncbi:hypothetical protein DPMN_122092 [Dreissena polymorpha]|uniref:Uncharacterized protein n=1 Tax=Dreissena polymorpha TaxID=45954 RepID=A0A9D4GN41_DREPO|nr:hypothetical protein DPMN_121637 [Dreissena polymorpha]KAH3820346.1 hypothetical protein DPMN_122092 [Dreissena polymorpha]